MKTIAVYKSLLTVVIAGAMVAGCGTKEIKEGKEKIAKLEKRAATAETSLAAVQTEFDAQKQATAQLQEKLDQAVKEASDSSSKLAEANARVKALEAANEKRVEDAKTAALIPAPIVKNGVYTFPKLMSSKMEDLGSNMEFSSRFGRKLIFKAEDGNRSKFDVDQLHSVILSALSIDPEAAKADQAKIDAGNKAFAENSAKQTAAYNASMEQAEEAAAKAGAAAQALNAQQPRPAMAQQAQQGQQMQPTGPMRAGKRKYQ